MLLVPIREGDEGRGFARARPRRSCKCCGLLDGCFTIDCTSKLSRVTPLLLFNWAVKLDMSPMQACMTLNGSSVVPSLVQIGQTAWAYPGVCNRWVILWHSLWPLLGIQIQTWAHLVEHWWTGAEPRTELLARKASDRNCLGNWENSRRLKTGIQSAGRLYSRLRGNSIRLKTEDRTGIALEPVNGVKFLARRWAVCISFLPQRWTLAIPAAS